MKTTKLIYALITAALLSLNCGGDAQPAVSCAGCGNGSVECDGGSLQECVAGAGGACSISNFSGGGALTLRPDGSYDQTYPDGTQGSGTYSIGGDLVTMRDAQGVGWVTNVYADTCPYKN